METVEFLATATIALLALFLLAIIMLPRSRSKGLWILARNPVIAVPAAYMLQRRSKPNWPAAAGCARHCPRTIATRTLLDTVSTWGCPPGNVIVEIVERGLLPPLALAARKQCSSPQEYPELMETLRGLLGPWSMGPIIYVCYRNTVTVKTPSGIYTSLKLPKTLSYQVRAAPYPGEDVLLLRYGCKGHGIALETLSLKILPEAPTKLPYLMYHVGLEPLEPDDPERIVEIVERIAKRLASIAQRIDPEKRPWEAILVANELGTEELDCPAHTSVTDRPVLGCPYYSPYKILRPREPGPHTSIIESLRARGGNPVRAAVNLALHNKPEWAEAILKHIAPGIARPTGPVQVEPWYLGCTRLKPKEKKCFRPPIDCEMWKGPGPVETWAWRLGMKIDPPPCESPARKEWEEPEGEIRSIRPVGDGFLSLIHAAKNMLDGRVLVVTAGEPEAHVVSSVTGLPLADNCQACNRAVTSWERLELEPWIADTFDSLLLLYPERFPKPPAIIEDLARGKTDRYYSRSKSWVKWLASHQRSASLSWILPEEKDSIILGEAGESEENPLSARQVIKEINRLLKRYWSPEYNLREYQEKAIAAVLEGWRPPPGRPVLSVFPTGYGKSAVFQLAGLVISRLTGRPVVVVSPLRALIRDQVESLTRKGLAAARIDSGITGRRRKSVLQSYMDGYLDFLYITPERFIDPGFYQLFVSLPPSIVVLDEAHTVVKWGGSFRPSYYYAVSSIQELRSDARTPYVSLFTASAPGRIAGEILSMLGVSEPIEVRLDRDEAWPDRWNGLILRVPAIRDNIFFTAVRTKQGEERIDDLVNYIRQLSRQAEETSNPWLGVVFTSYVKSERHPWANADTLAETIEKRTGIPTISYHGQLGDRERRERENMIYEASRTGRGPRIIVATKAFGMGIDIPNIRWIIHALPTDSIEDYYQEAGRAGRDGLPSVALHLYNPRDFDDKRRSIIMQRPRPSSVLRIYNTLVAMHNTLRKHGGWPVLVIPLDALPSPTRAMKALDYLRSAGLLDYWIMQQEITAYRIPETHGALPGPEVLPWSLRLGQDIYLAPKLASTPTGWEKLDWRIDICSQTEKLIPLRISAKEAVVETAPCNEWKSQPLEGRPKLLLAILDIDREHNVIDVLPPDIFQHVSRLAALEVEALESYRKIIAEAAEIADRNGWSDKRVDQKLKKRIDEKLSTPPPPPPEKPPDTLVETVHTCPTSTECARIAAEIVVEAEKWLGSIHAVSLALMDETLYDLIAHHYKNLTGKALEARYHGVYRRVLAQSKIGLHRLMDYGYLIIVARSHQRTLDALSRLNGYPYHAKLLYHQDTHAGSRP